MKSAARPRRRSAGIDANKRVSWFMGLAGLGPATHEELLRRCLVGNNLRVQGGWVYIMANRPNGTLYVGVTSDLARRVSEHREGVVDGFTKKYALKRLIYFEHHDDIRTAIQREKNLKHWPRAWKVRLVHEGNPNWDDLYEQLA